MLFYSGFKSVLFFKFGTESEMSKIIVFICFHYLRMGIRMGINRSQIHESDDKFDGYFAIVGKSPTICCQFDKISELFWNCFPFTKIKFLECLKVDGISTIFG